MKRVIIVLIVISLCTALIAVAAALICYNNNRNNELAFQQLKKIVFHMKYTDVIDLLGDPIESDNSGLIKTEWRLANGDVVLIWFSQPDDAGDTLVIGYFVE